MSLRSDLQKFLKKPEQPKPAAATPSPAPSPQEECEWCEGDGLPDAFCPYCGKLDLRDDIDREDAFLMELEKEDFTI
jgi:hypothetical protein